MAIEQLDDRQTRPACQHCQAEEATLHPLYILDRTGRRVEVAVCRFCYLRLAGVKPRKAGATRPRPVR